MSTCKGMSSLTCREFLSEYPPDPSQPFPSPGSSFIPPPVPGPHEFAIPRSSLPRKMSKKDINDAVPATACNGTTNGAVSHTRASAPLSFLRSFVPRFIVSILNMPRSIWRVLPFQDPSAPDPTAAPLPPTPTQPASDPPDAHTHHHAHDPVSASDPQLSLPPSSHHTLHRLSTQSVTSLTSSRPAPPSPAVSRRASGVSRTPSRPVSDMSSRASSRPVSGAQHSRPVSGSPSRPASGTVQPTTPTTTSATTPTATTPSFLRHPHDRLPDLVPTIPTSDLTAAEPTPTPTHATTAPALIQIRDYGFAPADPRFTGQGPHVPRANRPAVLARRLASSSGSTPTSSSEGHKGDDNDKDDYEDEDDEGEGERMDVDEVQKMWEEVVDDGANGWSGFFGRAWGFGRASGAATGPDAISSGAAFPSRGDLDRNFGGEDVYEDMEIYEEGEAFSDEEGEGDTGGEPPLFPGLYRALYAFVPEGTAETKLDEDQLVRVIGRGGGVGWAVVVKDGLRDTGIHALVPESYLELVRLDGEEGDA
ncbi:hypothetical protein J3R83DRAFT_107 [Lanmaoa asiatica]|nr:hypothetical protein J3R83DRAFT_107 [Lanmaoa asiatica]